MFGIEIPMPNFGNIVVVSMYSGYSRDCEKSSFHWKSVVKEISQNGNVRPVEICKERDTELRKLP